MSYNAMLVGLFVFRSLTVSVMGWIERVHIQAIKGPIGAVQCSRRNYRNCVGYGTFL